MITTASETTNSQIMLGQVENPVSSPKVLPRRSLKQIADTEISYCNISFADFINIFRFEIADVIEDEFSGQIVFKLEYADKFLVQLKLNGYWELNGEPKFQLTDVEWNFEEKENNPTSAFVLNTFIAILCLSDKVKVEIPTIDYYFGVSFPSPLNKISEILQNRQLAYRLMVIERAFQVSLPFPKGFISGEEVESITFCYDSVVERNFKWICPSGIVPWIASQEYLSLLPEKNIPFSIQYGPEPIHKEIFGYSIDLGFQLAKIEEYVLDNFDDVKEKLSKLDGGEVLVEAHSKNGLMKIESITTPILSKNAFSKETQKLIDLEEKLDSMYFDKYLNSFSNAFENLSDEQIEAITERPTLEDNAFNF